MMTENTAELLLVLLVLAGLALLRGAIKSLWREPREMESGDQELYTLMVFGGCCMVFIPLIDVLVPWLEFADFRFSADLAWMGLLTGVLAVMLCRQALSDRPARKAPAERSGFIAQGIYCYIRHPFYAALMLLASAQILLIQNWLGAAAAVMSFGLVYGLRVPRDELRALETFGTSYLDYMTRTGSLLPRFHNHKQE